MGELDAVSVSTRRKIMAGMKYGGGKSGMKGKSEKGFVATPATMTTKKLKSPSRP